MTVLAETVHRMQGRLRFRIESRKHDEAFFRTLAERLRACEGVDSVAANPITGSVLILHRTTAEAIESCAAAQELFSLAQESPDEHRAVSVRIAEAAEITIRRADRWVKAATRGEVDLASLVFLGLVGAGAWQFFTGRGLPAGVTLLNYALSVLEAEEEALGTAGRLRKALRM
jgi:hypothetical protein